MAAMTTLRLLLGDCVERMALLPEGSVDAIICDPPYGIFFMSRAWDEADNIAFSQRFWTAAMRVLAPGGTVKAFSGSRTFHRMAAAMEEAGFVDVDVVGWGYASGFPKSLDVSKAIDKSKGLERKVVGTKRGVRGADGTGHETAMPGKAVGVKQVACDVPVTAPASPEAEAWGGWGTALKPAWEPVIVGRKP